MKINYNELSPEVQVKLNKLDFIEKTYSKENGNVVMYDGSKFYTSTMPASKEIIKAPTGSVAITDNEIRELSKHLFKSSNSYISTFDTNLLDRSYFSENFRNLLTEIPNKFICRAESKIKSIFIANGYYHVILDSGKLLKISYTNPSVQTSIDFLNIIKTNFACRSFVASSITCIHPYDTGYLVGTLSNGVFYINPNKGIYEVKFPVNNTRFIETLMNGNILCITKDLTYPIYTYDFYTETLISKSNALSAKGGMQVPYRFAYTDEAYYILAKPLGIYPSENLLHAWEADLSKVIYQHVDNVSENKESLEYQIKFMNCCNEKIYVSGVKRDKLFIWIYDCNNLSKEPDEILFDKIAVDFDNLLIVQPLEDETIYFNNKETVYRIDASGNILENFMLKQYDGISQIMFYKTQFLAIDGKELLSYSLPKYSFYNALDFRITNYACNDITVLISSNNSKERALFYNHDTGEQVAPSFYIIDGNHNSIIKIKDCDCKNLYMKLTMQADTVINGIVINNNNIYIK